MELQGKNAIITGGSRGIGYAIARRFVREGINVVITARTTKALEQAAEELAEAGEGEVSAIPGDVSNHGHVVQLVKDTLEQYEAIDILVNNAGIGVHGSVDELSGADFQRVLEINLLGTFLLTHEVLPHMKERQSGYIYNIASYAGVKGLPGSGAYGASKAGIIRFSESLQREVTEDRIKVMAICPAFVETQMAEHSGVNSDEMIQPEDIAETILYYLRLSPATVIRQIVLERFGSV